MAMRIMCEGRDTCRYVPKVAPHVPYGAHGSRSYPTAQQTACGCPLPAPKRLRLAAPRDFDWQHRGTSLGTSTWCPHGTARYAVSRVPTTSSAC